MTITVTIDNRSKHRLLCGFLWIFLIGCFIAQTPTILNLNTVIGYRARHTSCREFLASSGRFKDNNWQPNGCRAFQYNKLDVARCLNRTQLKTKRRNYFLFIGDSVVREQYHLFVEAIASKSKPYTLSVFKGTTQFKDDLFDAEFQMSPYIKFMPNFKELLTRRRPTFVVVGFGLWLLRDCRGRFQHCVRTYSDRLKNISVELNLLSNVTEVIFMANSPLFQHLEYISNTTHCVYSKYTQLVVNARNKSVCINPWMCNTIVNEFNKAVVRELSTNSKSKYLWLTSRYIAQSFAFDTFDTMHLWSISGNAPPSPALHLRAQMLINFHCNQFRDADTEAEDVDVCCGRNDR